MPDAPDFSPLAGAYAVHRPGYPAELFEWLASVCARHDLAWDTATGNGQAAFGLAERFRRVVATDVSEAQIAHARPHPRIEYRVGSAEDSGLGERSVDLVAAAAAVHWFDLPKFRDEIRRVLRPGGVAAIWTYHAADVEPPFDAVLGPFYRDVVAPHFAGGARLVDDRYRGIELPGEEIAVPEFFATARWTAAEIVAYVRTWSGVRAYREATGEDPVAALAPAIERACGRADAVHRVTWPLYVRVWRS